MNKAQALGALVRFSRSPFRIHANVCQQSADDIINKFEIVVMDGPEHLNQATSEERGEYAMRLIRE